MQQSFLSLVQDIVILGDQSYLLVDRKISRKLRTAMNKLAKKGLRKKHKGRRRKGDKLNQPVWMPTSQFIKSPPKKKRGKNGNKGKKGKKGKSSSFELRKRYVLMDITYARTIQTRRKHVQH